MARMLFLTNWFPPHHRGGYEVNCADVAERMAERGHQVVVLCGNELLPGVSRPDVLQVHRDLELYWRDEEPWRPSWRRVWRMERQNKTTLEKVLDGVQPDVVAVWHMAVMSLNLLSVISRRRIPVVYSICDAWPLYALSMDPWALFWNRSKLRKVGGKVVELLTGRPAVLPDLGRLGPAGFVSTFLADQVCSTAQWDFRDRVIVASGIDRPSLGGSRSPGRPWSWQLVYMGRFDTRKGTDTLLSALRLLPEATLTMYGRAGDTERKRLLDLASRLGVADRVRMGMLDRPELGRAYRDADCVIFPSEWAEPFGLVPLEAMECGVPVVATGVGGSADFLVDRVNSLVFPPGDPELLATSVRSLAHDGELRERLVASGKQTAEQYSVDRMADAYELLYLRAIEESMADTEFAVEGGPIGMI